MSQKTHPKILKVTGKKDNWLSRGFYGRKYPQFLEEDFKVRQALKKMLPRDAIEEIEIERGGTSLKVIIKTSRPALVIGRGGEGVEKIQRKVLEIVNSKKYTEIINKEASQKRNLGRKDVKIEVVTIKNPWTSALLASQWIASQLEKRVPYRRALKMALQKIMSQKEVKGARVQVAGRLNGIEIARTEWLQEGELPRQTIAADLDYGFSQAYCTYGVIGVKVWIHKNIEPSTSL